MRAKMRKRQSGAAMRRAFLSAVWAKDKRAQGGGKSGSARFRGKRLATAHRRQSGQALTEIMLSSLLVLIPAFIFGWAIYAYGQARTSALNGARYAAWERTVWREGAADGVAAAVRSAGEIEEHMVERFFGKADAVIRSTYPSGNRSGNADLPSFYSVHNGDKVVDIERPAGSANDGQASRPTLKLYDNGETTSTLSTVYNAIENIMGILGGGGMELEDKGLYVAEVNLNLNAIRNVKVFDSLNLNLTQRAAVVTDAWSAGGKKHEETIVRPLVPFSLIDQIIEPLNDISALASVAGDGSPFREFKPGCVRGDVVPTDALAQPSEQVGQERVFSLGGQQIDQWQRNGSGLGLLDWLQQRNSGSGGTCN